MSQPPFQPQQALHGQPHPQQPPMPQPAYGQRQPQQPPMPQPPPGRAPKQKRFGWLPLIITAVIALVIGSAIGGSGTDSPAAAGPAATVTAPAPTVTVTEPVATDEEPAPTEEPTEEPDPEPTEDPAPKPQTFSGRGSDVIKFKKPITDAMLVTTTWNGPQDNNTIYAIDAEGNDNDLLVNTIGSYKGTNLINLYEGDSVRALKVEGSGSWKIRLRPVSAAKAWDGSGTYKGSSDDVINVKDVFDGLDSLRFKSTQADGNITVYGLGDGEELIVNDIGNFSGKHLVPEGVVLFRVSSDGSWSMKRE